MNYIFRVLVKCIIYRTLIFLRKSFTASFLISLITAFALIHHSYYFFNGFSPWNAIIPEFTIMLCFLFYSIKPHLSFKVSHNLTSLTFPVTFCLCFLNWMQMFYSKMICTLVFLHIFLTLMDRICPQCFP